MDYGPKRCDAGDRHLRGSRITGFLTQALTGGEETESAPVPPLDGLGIYADSGFEPVSAETQPLSGRLTIQISDIEDLSSRLALEISALRFTVPGANSPSGILSRRPHGHCCFSSGSSSKRRRSLMLISEARWGCQQGSSSGPPCRPSGESFGVKKHPGRLAAGCRA